MLLQLVDTDDEAEGGGPAGAGGGWQLRLSSLYFARLLPRLQQCWGIRLVPPAAHDGGGSGAGQHPRITLSEEGLTMRYSLQQGALERACEVAAASLVVPI